MITGCGAEAIDLGMRGRVFQWSKGRGRPWSYSVDLTMGGDGKRRQRLKRGFRTRADAERALADLIVSIDQGTAIDPTRQTLGAYLEDWLIAADGRGLF